ncbi:MAG: hypothetical protein MJ147_03275 [Clostridia bacterium]|nr:hypothetical protein [Clostridia bacterium]
MENFLKEQIKYGLKYLPKNLVKSFFIPSSNNETEAFRKKGFICGVCHPNENYEQIKGANIGWVRFDIPFPFDKDGNISTHYLSFKERALGYEQNGIKVMAVTPYPNSYIEGGADIRNAEGKEKVKEITTFLIKDLQGIVSGFQITNEMGMPHFTLPLNMTEAAEFIAVQLEAVYPHKGDIIVGYNSAGPQADLHCKLLPYVKYCDYVGIDIYLGCFDSFPGFMCLFDALIRYVWAMTKKPVIIQEFGYMSGGKPKTKKEKIDILASYGVGSEKEAKEKIASLVEKLPQSLKEHTKKVCENNESRYFNLIFKSDITNHFYREMPRITKIPGYDHTPEGQAKFYKDIFARFYKKKCVAGAIIYCYSDADHCYICGQDDCPIETRWGLVTRDGEPKPSYYAVKEALAKIK